MAARATVQLCISMLVISISSPPAVAKSKHAKELQEEASILRKRPDAPPSLSREAPDEPLRCRRYYLYRKKKYPCDSLIRWDGEGIRPIIKRVPQALNELNTYQTNRRSVRWTAYAVTGGALIGLVGALVNLNRKDAGGNVTAAGRTAAIIFGAVGVGISAGSIIYSKTMLSLNENHLDRAVDFYNQAYPKDPITLHATIPID